MNDALGKESKKTKKDMNRNPGGRPKGIPNKTTMMVKELISAHVKGEPVQHLLKLIDELPVEAQVENLQRLMPYCYPRLTAIEHSGQVDNNSGVEVAKLTELLIKMKME